MDTDWYTLIEEKYGIITESVLCRYEWQSGKGYAVTEGSEDRILNLDAQKDELQWKSAN